MALRRSDIANGLRELGLTPGDVVLVHSSLKSLGWVDGGAEAVIDGVIDAVSPGGTMVVPTITGSREYNAKNPPVFDVRKSLPWTGTIPCAFLRRPEAKRSLHPTHSVAAIGPLADELIRDHELSPTPCGEETPYYRLAKRGGKILFIGVTLDCCTALHGVEEIGKAPYHLQKEPAVATIIDGGGKSRKVKLWLHAYLKRNFSQMEPLLKERDAIWIGKIGDATVRLVDARTLFKVGLEMVVQDPYFFSEE